MPLPLAELFLVDDDGGLIELESFLIEGGNNPPLDVFDLIDVIIFFRMRNRICVICGSLKYYRHVVRDLTDDFQMG